MASRHQNIAEAAAVDLVGPFSIQRWNAACGVAEHAGSNNSLGNFHQESASTVVFFCPSECDFKSPLESFPVFPGDLSETLRGPLRRRWSSLFGFGFGGNGCKDDAPLLPSLRPSEK